MSDLPRVEQRQLVESLRGYGLETVLVRAAIDLAVAVHGEQTRAGGGPYLEEHIYPVTSDVARYLLARDYSGDAHDAVIIALLHDTIEDSDTVSRETIEKEFGEPVAAGVATLTKPGKVDRSQRRDLDAERRYLTGVRAAPLPVKVVKVFDRLNNLAGLHLRTPDERRAYLAETREHYLDLAQGVDPELHARMQVLMARVQ